MPNLSHYTNPLAGMTYTGPRMTQQGAVDPAYAAYRDAQGGVRDITRSLRDQYQEQYGRQLKGSQRSQATGAPPMSLAQFLQGNQPYQQALSGFKTQYGPSMGPVVPGLQGIGNKSAPSFTDAQIQQYINAYKGQPGMIAGRLQQLPQVSPEQFVRAAGGIGYTPQRISQYFANPANMGGRQAPAGLMQYLNQLGP